MDETLKKVKEIYNAKVKEVESINKLNLELKEELSSLKIDKGRVEGELIELKSKFKKFNELLKKV